jgi:hypothetical protein
MVMIACSAGHDGSRLSRRDGADARKERDLRMPSFPDGRRIERSAAGFDEVAENPDRIGPGDHAAAAIPPRTRPQRWRYFFETS